MHTCILYTVYIHMFTMRSSGRPWAKRYDISTFKIQVYAVVMTFHFWSPKVHACMLRALVATVYTWYRVLVKNAGK